MNFSLDALDMSSDSQAIESWTAAFCNAVGHEYFAEVSEDFIQDDFNLTGLASQVPMYKEALQMILDAESDDEDDELSDEEDDYDEDMGDDGLVRSRRKGSRGDIAVIEASAELLYGLIHARFINSRQGMAMMHEKYELNHFGLCPRVMCNGCRVLPVGVSDTPGQETVKLFCASCLDIYTPPNSRFQTVDGAFFGTTFGSLFFMTYPELQFGLVDTNGTSANPADVSPYRRSPWPDQPTEIHGMALHNFAPGLGSGNIYEPKIYGFRVSEKSRTGPRMRWLRSKPDDLVQLDEVLQYRHLHGGGSEGSDDEGEDGGMDTSVGAEPRADAIGRRKKAPMRQRRRVSGDPVDGRGDLNGVT